MPGLRTISGQALSRFGFGTMQFGAAADQSASAKMHAACREAGVNFLDTAPLRSEGRSGEISGRLVAPVRADVFVATKCGCHGACRSRIEEEFGASRRRLGMEAVDLLHLHRWDGETPLDETFETLAGYKEDGSVRAFGVSSCAAGQVMKGRKVARGHGVEIQLLQPMYSLVKRQVEVEILPMAVAEELAACPHSSLGGGRLTGTHACGATGRPANNDTYAARCGFDWMHEAVAKPARIAEEVGTAIDFEIDDARHARLSALSPAPPPATDRLEEA